MKKIILLVVVVSLIAAGWFLYFRGDDKIQEVSVVYADYKDLSNTLEFSGEVAPSSMYSVMSTYGGQIKSIKVSEGSIVKKGDTLLTLDTSQLEIELEKAQLSYDALTQEGAVTAMAQNHAVNNALAEEKAKIALALSQTTGYDYESFNSTFSGELSEQAAEYVSALNGFSLEEQIDAQADGYGLTDVDSQLATLEVTIKGLKKTIDQMTIKSEIAGRVIGLNVHEGEVLSPGYPAMVIADTNNTYISSYVYEKDIGELEEGMDVKILGDPGYYTGSISKIGVSAAGVGDSSVFDTMTSVEITPSEYFDRMPGAVVDIEVTISEANDVLALPIDCFTDDDCIFTVDDEGILQKRTVVVGFKDMYYAEIVSGLAEGEMVVVSPKELTEGQKVRYDTGE